jgi:2-alkenal reductase
VTIPINRKAIVLLLVIVLLVTSCSQLFEGGSSPEEADPIQETSSTKSEVVAPPTVDTAKIAAEVLAEVESNLTAGDTVQEPEPAQDAILADVLAQVETYLAEREEPMPVGLPESNLSLPDLQATLISLYRKANPAVVYIIVPPLGSGSGFVFSDEGYIVTNNHVAELGQEYEVVFANGERRAAELIGRDVDSDLAVIKVDNLPESVNPLPIHSSDDLQVGQFVAAIGNPFGEQGSMSMGIISGLDRSLSSARESAGGSSYSLPEVIQTDAPINPGNSGGPLLNLDGEVVGVNSAIATTTGANTGVGFSIPSDAVLRIVPSLISGGSYDYPYMGVSFDGEITLEDQTLYQIPQTQGAYVVSVTAGGPGEQAGLQAANSSTGRGGDLIIDIDGVPINDFSDLNSYLVFHTSVGQTISITVLRNGEKVVLSLTLGARPEN